MPVISVDREELLQATGADQVELLEAIPKLGIEIEKIEDDSWDLEVAPDRCDMLSVEGIARAIKGYLGKETGIPQYEVTSSDVVTDVEPSVEEVRPYIVTAVIKDLELDLAFLESLMDVQEKLHLTIGRDRAKVAIGIHDFANVNPPFTYKAVGPEEVSFLPLQKRHEMTLKEILEKHEKGREFSSILEHYSRYPLITDKDENVLSFPPIINGQLSEVTRDTEEIFIDMTGTDRKALEDTLNIICTMFSDRGGQVYSTQVIYDEKDGEYIEETYPDLEPDEIQVDIEETRKVLGISLSEEEIKDCLTRARYNYNMSDMSGEEGDVEKGEEHDGEGCEGEEYGEGNISVETPPYRHDILHPYDVIEDIAISYGFDEFEGSYPEEVTFGKREEGKELENTVAEVLVGYGFQEVMNYSLSEPSREYETMRSEKEEPESLSKLDNPVTEDMTCLRRSLIPQLLSNLRENKKEPTPQKMFELGDVVEDKEQFTMVAGAVLHSEAGFTEMKSIIQGLLKDLGLDAEIGPSSEGYLIDGRQASYKVEGTSICTFGEVKPEVLDDDGIENPTTAFELYLDDLYEIRDQ